MPTKPHILITAGPTREPIDHVRDWGNIFTGKTGLDLALAFLNLGNVTLLTSNTNDAAFHDGQTGQNGTLTTQTFRSYSDLHTLLHQHMTSPDNPVHIAAMTAAVSDYSPDAVYRILQKSPSPTNPNHETWIVENASAPKVKSNLGEIAVRGTPTPKLIDLFRSPWNFTGILIKFKLEVAISEPQLLAIAAQSRLHSHADLIVANTLAMARPAPNEEPAAYLIDDSTQTRIPRRILATQIVHWTQHRLPQKK